MEIANRLHFTVDNIDLDYLVLNYLYLWSSCIEFVQILYFVDSCSSI